MKVFLKSFILIVSLILSLGITASQMGVDNPNLPNVDAFIEEADDCCIGGNLTHFLNLTDTPASYSGEGGNCVAVNGGETGLEFIGCGGAGGNPFDQSLNTTDLVEFEKVTVDNLDLNNNRLTCAGNLELYGGYANTIIFSGDLAGGSVLTQWKSTNIGKLSWNSQSNRFEFLNDVLFNESLESTNWSNVTITDTQVTNFNATVEDLMWWENGTYGITPTDLIALYLERNLSLVSTTAILFRYNGVAGTTDGGTISSKNAGEVSLSANKVLNLEINGTDKILIDENETNVLTPILNATNISSTHYGNSTDMYTLADFLLDTGGEMNYTNLAMTNKTNVFSENQNFSTTVYMLGTVCYDSSCNHFTNETGEYWDGGDRYIISNGSALWIKG